MIKLPRTLHIEGSRLKAGEVDPDHPCGDDLYSVRLTAIDDGRLLYKDGEWPETAKDQG